MISEVTGELKEVDEGRVLLSVGPFVLELLVPASEVDALRQGVGESVTFHTIFYFEGDSSGGNSEPRLLGFLRSDDKKFFEKFITVKGIGPRKALRALIIPSGEIAAAIEGRDPKALSKLPGIGKRTAEQIIAELSGKVQAFVTFAPKGSGTASARVAGVHGIARTPVEEDAILSLMALGERRQDAELLLERARSVEKEAASTDALVRAMLRLRGSR